MGSNRLHSSSESCSAVILQSRRILGRRPVGARAASRTRKVKHDFAYTGLVRCGHCGCLLVGELKKGKYVYYHCTGNRGKCPERYTRQEILSGEFANVLRELVIPPPVLEWLGDAVLESDRTEQAARAESIKKLKSRYDQIGARIETMYIDKLDGRITQEFSTGRQPRCAGSKMVYFGGSRISRRPHRRPSIKLSTCSA
jgi:hypothetical protein